MLTFIVGGSRSGKSAPAAPTPSMIVTNVSSGATRTSIFPNPRAMFWLLVSSITGLNYYRVARAGRIWAPIANLHNRKRFGFDYRLSLRLSYVVWAVLVYGAILWSPFPVADIGSAADHAIFLGRCLQPHLCHGRT
ncbi:hypothetical protein [Sphingobium sp. D43FB]|uniref:hypothetical protein n=1 Tax=Sphingobium sp. D43FB TaxID=2017595 RepID=UPI0020D1ACEE|nr:hypothetical protein [Sphingobium sp. D43FB]